MSLPQKRTSTPSLQPRRASKCALGCGGYSLTEMIWVVALIAILAGIAISQFVGITDGSKLAIAKEKVEMLNRALHDYVSIKSRVDYPTPRTDSGDENMVLLTLQFRHSTNPTAGAPYVSPRYRPTSSSSSDDYRIQWTGSMFKLLAPGATGTGLLVAFDGSDLGTPFPFTDNFRPLGR